MFSVTAPHLRRYYGRGILAGLITGAVAMGVAQLAAGVSSPTASPVVAVGGAVIDRTPPALKDFAIREFGKHDKMALVIGILAMLAVFAATFGGLAVRRLRYGLAGLAVFAAIGVAAAVTRPNAGAGAATPTLIGAVAGAVALILLVGTAQRRAPAPSLSPGESLPDSARPAPATPGLAHPRSTPPSEPAGGAPGGATRTDRRQFMVVSAAAVGTAAVTAVAGRALADRFSVAGARSALRFPSPAHPAALAPGSDLAIPGLASFITPNSSFYRVDTALVLPQIEPSRWRLRIHGLVEREIEISFDDLMHRPLIENYVTLTCVSNPVAGPYIGNARWLGASLASLLREARVRAGADQLLCTSADGFTSGTPVQAVLDGRNALLALAMNGAALPVGHGFPVRMVVPGLYGYVSATKWVTDIKVTTFAAETAYWSQRGWSQQAPIKTESRIDVPNGSATLGPGPTQVAGVAWAQHKGIDAVEVRVDGGPWQPARLAGVPGVDTWRQWVWEWDATPGKHRIEARATDATGYTQTAAQSDPPPNGATGYPSITVRVSPAKRAP
jgi:DMSO/TMAO reductase YedYZ molybdopterin-dependent catalytic subunit